MTQQNEAIRLAVEALKKAEGRHQKIRNALDFIRYGTARKTVDGRALADAGNSLSAARTEVATALEALRPLIDQTSAGVGDGRHQWDRDGERCVKCGDKDWMNDPVCKGRALTQADQPADKDDRRDLLDKIDITLDYFRDEFPGEKDVWADPISAYAGGISANDLLKIKRALSGPEPVEKAAYRDPEWNDLYPGMD